jgi:hypothetical protein
MAKILLAITWQGETFVATRIELEEGRGVLFTNDYAKHPKAPGFKGHFKIDGTQHKVSAWLKESSNGSKFISLAIDTYAATGQTYPKEVSPKDDDSIPF